MKPGTNDAGLLGSLNRTQFELGNPGTLGLTSHRRLGRIDGDEKKIGSIFSAHNTTAERRNSPLTLGRGAGR